MHAPRRILGFGRAGWVALVGLALAVALAVWAMLSPAYTMQPRYAIQSWITSAFGWEAMITFTAWLAYTALRLTGGTFTLVTLLLLLPAFHLAPKRFPWWLVGALTVISVGVPLMCVTWKPVGHILPSMWVSWVPVERLALEEALIGLGAGLLLFAYSRSMLVAAGAVIAFVVSCTSGHLFQFGLFIAVTEFVDIHIGNVTWNLLMAGPMYVWALRGRRVHLDDRLCKTCAYDVSGVPGTTCPECGAPFKDP